MHLAPIIQSREVERAADNKRTMEGEEHYSVTPLGLRHPRPRTDENGSLLLASLGVASVDGCILMDRRAVRAHGAVLVEARADPKWTHMQQLTHHCFVHCVLFNLSSHV